MKYKELKVLSSALLYGDNKLPSGEPELKALLMLAFNDIASRAQSLRLMTKSINKEVLRGSVGDYLTRYPDLPVDDESELDMDKDLCFAASRFIASYISKNKPDIHRAEGEKIILLFNSKVNSMIESVQVDEEGNGYVKT